MERNVNIEGGFVPDFSGFQGGEVKMTEVAGGDLEGGRRRRRRSRSRRSRSMRGGDAKAEVAGGEDLEGGRRRRRRSRRSRSMHGGDAAKAEVVGGAEVVPDETIEGGRRKYGRHSPITIAYLRERRFRRKGSRCPNGQEKDHRKHKNPSGCRTKDRSVSPRYVGRPRKSGSPPHRRGRHTFY